MRRALFCALVGLLCVTWTVVRAEERVKEVGATEGGRGAVSDQTFALKASESGLAEVNLSRIALKQAESADVKKFAQKMIDDHTKANKELISLANKKKLKLAPTMDAMHEALATKLASLSGAGFDRAYMAGQVKDHEVAVALFEKESKGGMDEDVKDWATQTLPHLREHLKMAQTIHGRLSGDTKGGSGTGGGSDRDR